jgi:hypothetical protein
MTDEIYGKIETARKRGVSDEAIRKFLMDHPLVEQARSKGVADAKIFEHLGLAPREPGVLETIASEANTILGNIEPDVMAIGQSLTPVELSRTINRAVMSPLETAKSAVTGVGEFLQHPYETFRERPVSTLLGVTPFAVGGAKLLGGARRIAAPVLEPQRAAVQNVMGQLTEPQAFANAMARSVPVTPGAPAATASQAAVAAGLSEPAVAGMESSLMNVTRPYGREVFGLQEQRFSAIQQQIRRIENDIAQRADTMSPAEVAQLRTVRDDLMRQLAAEQQSLTQQGQALVGNLPAASQRVQGEVIQQTAAQLKQTAKKQQIEPAYEQPIRAAGRRQIDITPVVALSEQVLGRPLTAFQPETAPGALARELASLRRPPSQGDWVSLGEGAGYYGEPGLPAPTTASLRQIDAIRRGINADLAQAAQATDAGAATRYAALKEMSSRLNAAVEQTGAIPDSVKAGYRRANELYRTEYAPRFKTGITADMLQRTSRGVTKLLPDDIVDAVLKNETNAEQFVNTFRGDSTAQSALNASIVGRVREAALDPTTGFIRPEKIDAFLQNPALDALGVDLRATLQPLRDEAIRINDGLTELSARARKVGKTDAGAVVDAALKNAPEMNFVLSRIGPNAREALRKQVTDRALGFIRADAPDKTIKFLDKHAKPLRIAIGDEAVNDIRGLANAQSVLQKAEKAAPMPRQEVATQIDRFTPEQLTDINVLLQEMDRLEKVSGLSNVRPTGTAADLAAQEGLSASQIPGFLSKTITFTKSMLDRISNVATQRMQVEMANLLVKDRELLGRLINESLAKKTRKSPALRASVAGAAITQSQNQNAMAR